MLLLCTSMSRPRADHPPPSGARASSTHSLPSSYFLRPALGRQAQRRGSRATESPIAIHAFTTSRLAPLPLPPFLIFLCLLPSLSFPKLLADTSVSPRVLTSVWQCVAQWPAALAWLPGAANGLLLVGAFCGQVCIPSCARRWANQAKATLAPLLFC